MNEIETNDLSEENVPQNTEDLGFTFNWWNLIIGAVICYFWFSERWAFVISLLIVIIIHEMGHIIISKKFGCMIKEVQVFFLSFISYKPKPKPDAKCSWWRNIKWSIGSLPLGGITYFKERPNYMIYDNEEDQIDEKEKAAKSPYVVDKPAWQRLIISAGGVLFNFATFLIIYLSIFISSIISPNQYYLFWSDSILIEIMIISLVVAVLNILPVYPLDGGNILFESYEMITGKKMSPRFVNVCGIIGFVIIILFFFVFTGWMDKLFDPLFRMLF
jgi:membrane-associated protease RseP (regulator of RpoE activity)